jgi:hypothetical protein
MWFWGSLRGSLDPIPAGISHLGTEINVMGYVVIVRLGLFLRILLLVLVVAHPAISP